MVTIPPLLAAGHRPTASEFQMYRDAIQELQVPPWIYKTADQANNSVTFANDAHLSVPVLANTAYAMEFYGMYATPTAALMKVQWALPGGTLDVSTFAVCAPGGTVSWAATSAGGNVIGLPGHATADIPLILRGTLFIGATAGTARFQFAQTNASSGPTVFRKGTRVHIRPL